MMYCVQIWHLPFLSKFEDEYCNCCWQYVLLLGFKRFVLNTYSECTLLSTNINRLFVAVNHLFFCLHLSPHPLR